MGFGDQAMRARMATRTHTASRTTCERLEEVAMRPAAVDSETVAKIMTIRITKPNKTREPGPCGFSFQTARGTVMIRSRKTITAPMSKRISIGAALSIVQKGEPAQAAGRSLPCAAEE